MPDHTGHIYSEDERAALRYMVFRRWQARPKGFYAPGEYGPWHLIESTRGTTDLAVCGAATRTFRGVRVSEERPADRLCPKCKAHDDRRDLPVEVDRE